MNQAIWGKLTAGAFLAITNILFVISCRQEQVKQALYIQPQYNTAVLSVPAEVGSEQTTEQPSALTPTQQKKLSVFSAPLTSSTDTRLDNRIDLSAITIGTPLGRVIEIPPLNIVVFWNDLRDNAQIDRYTPVGAEPVSGVSLRKNLEILLASLPVKLDYTVIDGVIVIATKDSLPKKMLRRTYDITDLTSRPADYYSGTN